MYLFLSDPAKTRIMSTKKRLFENSSVNECVDSQTPSQKKRRLDNLILDLRTFHDTYLKPSLILLNSPCPQPKAAGLLLQEGKGKLLSTINSLEYTCNNIFQSDLPSVSAPGFPEMLSPPVNPGIVASPLVAPEILSTPLLNLGTVVTSPVIQKIPVTYIGHYISTLYITYIRHYISALFNLSFIFIHCHKR